jgi:hypothetical protein
MAIEKLDLIKSDERLMMVLFSNGWHCFVITNSVNDAVRTAQNEIDGEYPRVKFVFDGDIGIPIVWEDDPEWDDT